MQPEICNSHLSTVTVNDSILVTFVRVRRLLGTAYPIFCPIFFSLITSLDTDTARKLFLHPLVFPQSPACIISPCIFTPSQNSVECFKFVGYTKIIHFLYQIQYISLDITTPEIIIAKMSDSTRI